MIMGLAANIDLYFGMTGLMEAPGVILSLAKIRELQAQLDSMSGADTP
jgi:hypothetical protein